jgi:hypothetical protein
MPISFKCGSCGQALKVKDELANRRVKCPKCAQPAQVPAAAPQDDPEIRIVEEGPASPDPAPLPSSPRAGAPPVPGRTRPAARPQESEMPYILRGAAGGVAAAVLGAFVWYLLAKGLHAKIGWIAWGIGWAAGFGVVVLSGGKGGTALPFLGAGTALFGWLLGEYFIYSWMFQDLVEKEAMKEAGKAANRPELQELVRTIVANISFMDYLKASFEGIDILFIVLAVATGWGVPKKMGATG